MNRYCYVNSGTIWKTITSKKKKKRSSSLYHKARKQSKNSTMWSSSHECTASNTSEPELTKVPLNVLWSNKATFQIWYGVMLLMAHGMDNCHIWHRCWKVHTGVEQCADDTFSVTSWLFQQDMKIHSLTKMRLDWSACKPDQTTLKIFGALLNTKYNWSHISTRMETEFHFTTQTMSVFSSKTLTVDKSWCYAATNTKYVVTIYFTHFTHQIQNK